METQTPTFFLKNCFIKEVYSTILEEDNKDDTEVKVFFQESSEDYDKDKSISNRALVDLIIANVQIKMEVISEVEVSDNSLAYDDFVKQYIKDLIHPGLDKASVLISEILEKMTNFPRAIDLLNGFTEEDS